MAHMIEVTKKVYGDNDLLVDEKFVVNADNINKVENSDRIQDWAKSIIYMNDGTTIDTVESKEEISRIIND